MDRSGKIRLFYGIFLGAFTVVLGVVFLCEAADLCYSETGYTYEGVAARLKLLLAPILLWVAAAVAGYVLSVIFPAAERRRKTDPVKTLARMKRRLPQTDGFAEEKKLCKRYEGARIAVWSVSAAFALASAVIAVVYLADPSHFPARDLNAEVIAMGKSILPFFAVSFLLFAASAAMEHFVCSRELAVVRRMLAQGGVKPAPASVRSSRAWIWAVRIAIALLGLLFFVWGIVNGGMNDVLVKAVGICRECIGLG